MRRFPQDISLLRLKILRVTDSYPPPWSGLNPGPYAISIAQARQGHDVHVITKYSENCEKIDENSKVVTHRIKARSYFFELMAFLKFVQLNKLINFDLIHVHGISFFLFHLLFKKLVKKPVSMSVHSIRKKQYSIYKKRRIAGYGLKEKVELFKEWVCIKNSDYFFPVSHGLKNELLSLYNVSEDRITITRNGVDPSFTAPFNKSKAREELGFDEEFILLFVGTLNGRKDVGQVLNVLQKLRRGGYPIKFIVVGSGPMRDFYVKTANDFGLADSTTFIENLPQRALRDLYRACDAFVLPSYYEGLPKVVLEAMACGLPVICSDIPGNNEIVSHRRDGLLFPMDDLEALESNILYLMTNRNSLEKMGTTAREKVGYYYTWERVAQNIEDGYKKILLLLQSAAKR